MIYLDNAATTPVREEALKAMAPYFNEKYGNPSSAYEFGADNREVIEKGRKVISKMINCSPEEIYYTSGGTESDNFAIKQVCRSRKHKGNHIITSCIEHHAVLNSCRAMEREGFRVTYLKVDETGRINLNELKNAMDNGTILISIMHANNEIGTIEPVYKIGEIAKRNGILFHTDAVQSFGHIPIDVKYMNMDLLSASGHKFGGPKGVGFMYVKNSLKLYPFMDGGGQESGLRGGTGNVSGIVGMTEAAYLAGAEMRKNIKYISGLRDYFLNRIFREVEGVSLNGHTIYRLPGNINISIKGVDGTALMVLLDMEGICVSTGSACSQGDSEPSHVLKAIKKPNESMSDSIRITLSERNTKEEMDYTAKCIKTAVQKLRSKQS